MRGRVFARRRMGGRSFHVELHLWIGFHMKCVMSDRRERFIRWNRWLAAVMLDDCGYQFVAGILVLLSKADSKIAVVYFVEAVQFR